MVRGSVRQQALVAKAAALGVFGAGALACLLYACQEYDSSLLTYAQAGPDGQADAAIDQQAEAAGPEVVGDEAQAEAAPEAAPEDGPEASTEADAVMDGAPPACSATLVDCDGDEGNGCETDLMSHPLNCGKCAHGCLGGGCAQGRCLPVLLASGQSVPSMVAVDDTHVYWTNQAALGQVMRVPKSGGAPEVVGQSATPGGLAVDATSVFWSEIVSTSTVWRLDKSQIGQGSSAVALTTNQGASTGLALSDKHVYFTTSTMVKRVPKDGGLVETVASDQQQPGGLVVDLGLVFWTNLLGGTVCAGDTPDSGVLTLATGQDFPLGLTSDLGNLYWTNHMGGPDGGTPRVMAIAKVNMTAPIVLAEGQANPMGIVQAGSHVYWTNNTGGTVMRVTKVQGGTPEELANGQEAPAGIAIDVQRLYWSNRSSGQLMSLAR